VAYREPRFLPNLVAPRPTVFASSVSYEETIVSIDASSFIITNEHSLGAY